MDKEERLACLSLAIDTYRQRQALNALLAELAQQREARAAQSSAPASDASATTSALDHPPSTDSTAQVSVSEPLAHEDDAVVRAPALSPTLAEQYAKIEARAERRRLRWLELEAQRARELERGVPRTLPGVHPRYRLP